MSNKQMVKVKRPEAVTALKCVVDDPEADRDFSRMQLVSIYNYIVALEAANAAIQDQQPVNDRAFRAVCQSEWCRLVHYGATKDQAAIAATHCNHLTITEKPSSETQKTNT